MKLIDIIRLLIENKDLIFQIIEIIRQLKGQGDGTITIQSVEGEVAIASEQVAALGLGDNAIELVKLLLENWEAVLELINLFRGNK